MKSYLVKQTCKGLWLHKQTKSLEAAHQEARHLRDKGARFVRVLDEYAYKRIGGGRIKPTISKIMKATK